MKRTESCSTAQQNAEQQMVSQFSIELGRPLVKKTVNLENVNVTVDGFYEDERGSTFVEAWAHLGNAKAAQRHKVLADMLKLALITTTLRTLNPDALVESYLLFACDRAANLVRGRGWAALAAEKFGIKHCVVEISPETKETIREAQHKQDIRFVDECVDGNTV
jgi:hypothetical protein